MINVNTLDKIEQLDSNKKDFFVVVKHEKFCKIYIRCGTALTILQIFKFPVIYKSCNATEIDVMRIQWG